jgi:uncharacterized protein YyaL (SSP411 family)
MRHPRGGFYATQDADSEGEEGKFYVWTVDEIRDVLGAKADAFITAYGVVQGGNWEGRNILELTGTLDQREALAQARAKLYAARERRVHPGRDDKVLTSWNGLMLAAFVEAANALDRQDYLSVAKTNAAFLLQELRGEDGRLYRTWKSGPEQGEAAGQARLNGYLEDYADLAEGLLALYQADFDPRWYTAARQLVEAMTVHFTAPGGGFYDTSDDHEDLIARPRDLQDNATPSGNAMAAVVLLKLAGFTADTGFAGRAHESLAQLQSVMAQHPLGFGQWLQALSYTLAGPREIAIVGDPQAKETQTLLDVLRGGYYPFQVVALGVPGPQLPNVPLLRHRDLVDGQAAAYVCRNAVCQAPAVSAEALGRELRQL